MSEELVMRGQAASLTAAEIRAQVNLIQQVMRAVMVDGTHYGTIPGCGNKPALFKPGAEKLLSTFKIAVDPIVEDLSTPDECRFRVSARCTSMSDGRFLGAGIGEASSSEEKYRWRRAVCKEEFEETPEDHRREKWYVDRAKGESKKIPQVRTNPADVANTVLKMAKKRAQVDACLTVTAASDCFAQDIEDLPPELRQEEDAQARPPIKPPRAKNKPPVGQEPPKDKTPQEQPPQDAPPAGTTDSEHPHIKGVVCKLSEKDLNKRDGTGTFKKFGVCIDTGETGVKWTNTLDHKLRDKATEMRGKPVIAWTKETQYGLDLVGIELA